MARKSANQVIADALAFYMGDRWSQVTLGRASQVSPNTIGNALLLVIVTMAGVIWYWWRRRRR